MESVDLAAVLQEVGDSHSKASTRSQVQVEYIILRYISTSIRLPHFSQRYHHHCVVTANDGGKGRLVVINLCYDLWGGTWGWYHSFSIFCYVFVLLLIVLLWLMHGSCVCFFVPFLLSLSLVPLIRCCWCKETLLCFFCKTISIVRFKIIDLWISLSKGLV